MDFRSVFLRFALMCYIASAHSKIVVKIGAIFHGDDNPEAEVAFRFAISRLNMYEGNYELHPLIRRVPGHDSFTTGRTVCELVERGIAAIFGPLSSSTNEIIQSISANLEIPQFQVFWNPKLAQFSEEKEHDKPNVVFNLYPDPHMLAKAYAALLHQMKWNKYVIIYDRDERIIQLQEILKSHGPNDAPVIIKKLGPGPDYRPLLKEIKESSVSQIILDCETDHILNILEQAQEVKLMEEYYSYILTSLDAHSLDFGKLQPFKSGIFSLRIIDPNSREIRMVARDWELGQLNHNKHHIRIPPESIRTKAALIYDALNLFITVYSQLDITGTMVVKPLSCDGYEISDHGLRIGAFIHVRPMTQGNMIGPLTGPLQFDSLGRRTKFSLQIVERSLEGTRVMGVWDSIKPSLVNLQITEIQRKEELKKQINTKTFIVTSRIGEPYLMKRKPAEGEYLKGNDRFEGYVKDLLDGISKILQLKYELTIANDSRYGNYDEKTREWNGLIKEILDRKADLAICDLTITHDRRKAVDFTMPFMTLGISILHSKARKEPPSLLSFMDPLSLDVWLYMATAYLVISIVIFLVARLTPGDWENPHPCNQEPEQLENIWDLKNCFWLTLGSIMAQGCDILPKGISTRMITGMWWFFSLIMTASYTANMTAFLTNDRMGPTIESAEDLARQSKIKYGLYLGGATETFFKQSNFPLYERMWSQMEQASPTVFEKSNNDGVKRVKQSKGLFAYFMESSTLEYEKSKDCNLIQVGPWLDVKGYGIAMPVNSPYRTELSGAVLKMQESGVLHELKERWWKGKCEKDAGEQGTASMDLKNVGGVFVVLAGGITTALLVAIFEFIWSVKKIAVQEHCPFFHALLMELKFAVNFKVKHKTTKVSIYRDDKFLALNILK